MHAHAHLFAELRRLRWKLALAYTATTASVLSVLLVLLLVTATLLAGGREQQARYVVSALEQMAVQVAPLAASTPVDHLRLSVLLALALERSGIGEAGLDSSITMSAGVDPPGELGLMDRVYLLALDTEDRLVGSTLLVEQQRIGRPFELTSVPGLDELLAGDLGERSFVLNEAAGQVVVAVPIVRRERLGTLVYVANGLNDSTASLRVLGGQFGVAIAIFTAAAALVGLIFGLLTAHGLTRRLRAIERQTATWGSGDFSARLDDTSADEIGQLSWQLNRVADQFQALLRERQQLATLDERNRLARDLHDSVKQHVFAASMSLGAAQELWGEDAAAAAALTATAASATAAAQRELTDIIHALRPVELERVGLAQALADLTARWSAQTGIAVTTAIAEEVALPSAAEEALFRIAQEALTNVARHSGASAAALSLGVEQRRVILRVRDNGRGFDPGIVQSGLGLRSMRERAAALSATFSVQGEATGTSVQVALPASGRT